MQDGNGRSPLSNYASQVVFLLLENPQEIY